MVRIRSATPAAAPAPVLRQQPETALRPTAEPAFRPVMQPPVIQSRLEPSAMAYQSEAEARLDREMQLPEPPTQIVSEMAPVAVAEDHERAAEQRKATEHGYRKQSVAHGGALRRRVRAVKPPLLQIGVEKRRLPVAKCKRFA